MRIEQQLQFIGRVLRLDFGLSATLQGEEERRMVVGSPAPQPKISAQVRHGRHRARGIHGAGVLPRARPGESGYLGHWYHYLRHLEEALGFFMGTTTYKT